MTLLHSWSNMFAVFTGKIKLINYARYTMFKLGKCTADSLPPIFDSLHQHILPANFESYIRKHATTPILASPSPWDMVGNWKIINCKLYGEHKNLHQRASLNVFTVNVKKAAKQEDTVFLLQI